MTARQNSKSRPAATPQLLHGGMTRLALRRPWQARRCQKHGKAGDPVLGIAELPSADATPFEEEHILECLGAAVIMRWGTLPTKIQRELFESADNPRRPQADGSLKEKLRASCIITRMTARSVPGRRYCDGDFGVTAHRTTALSLPKGMMWLPRSGLRRWRHPLCAQCSGRMVITLVVSDPGDSALELPQLCVRRVRS